MKIIRKELTPAELSDPNVFYDATSDSFYQVFPPDTTHIPAPQQDPRTSTFFQRPPTTSVDPQCKAAANYVRHLSDYLSEILGILNITTTASSVVSVGLDAFAIGFPPGAPIDELALLMINGASAILGIGVSAVSSAFSPANYDKITCAYYDSCESDGSMTPTDLSTFGSEIASRIGGTVQTVMGFILAVQGNVGVSNWAGTDTTSSFDCTVCLGWCEKADLTVSDGGFVADFVNGTGANYVSGQGWEQNAVAGNSGTYIILTGIDTSSVFESISVLYDATGHVTDTVIYATLGGVVQILQIAPAGDGTGLGFVWSGSTSFDTLAIQVGNQSGGGPTGTSRVYVVEIGGSGTAPALFPPC